MDDAVAVKPLARTECVSMDTPQVSRVGQLSVLDGFVDSDEVFKLVEELPKACLDERSLENVVDRFTFIVDKYQEQPHLLDPHLDRLLEVLVNDVTPASMQVASSRPHGSSALGQEQLLFHSRFKLLYRVTKTRGCKVVIRHMPHEVADLEPVLSLLMLQDRSDISTWETRYMLLLWLSIIVIIPFHMSRLDAHIEQGGKKPIIDRILDIGKLYLASTDCCMEAASFLLSRFVVRPDVKEHHLSDFISWCLDRICAHDGSVHARIGELAVLAKLFKHGKREYTLPHSGHVLSCILEKDFRSAGVAPKKLYIKLVQRTGMTFLKPHVAAWRYQRGSRSLVANLKMDSPEVKQRNDLVASATGIDASEVVDGQEIDFPEDLERVIQELLTALKDKDTCIRWSAAKGVGRIASRLPKYLADDIVGSVLDFFSPQETDNAWHGGCLSLAEFGRRGILLPERLPAVIPIITKALVYDEQKGSYSVGDHIRDAACYVCWAFARAYDPDVMLPYVNDISRALLITAVFDREIHCRRAASAAFQENVGRQGTYPHGIDIVAAADYIGVGNIKNAFLSISVFIAQYPEYTKALIDHLVELKTMHWNLSVRILSGAALCNLTPCDPCYMAKEVLPQLMQRTVCSDLNTRHGSIIAFAEVLCGLIKCLCCEKNIEEIVDAEIICGLHSLVSTLQQRKYFRGLGGELMRKAVCHLIEKCSQAPLPIPDAKIVDLWQDFIDDCLRETSSEVQLAAVSALKHFCITYYKEQRLDKAQSLVLKYVAALDTSVESIRIGFCMALGSLPKEILLDALDIIIPALIGSSKIEKNSLHWARPRQESINALTNVLKCVGIHNVPERHILPVFECFFSGLDDYTIVESTGDVGSYVRTAAMIGIEVLVLMAIKDCPTIITKEITNRFMCGIAQQACEKIDNTRATAARIFHRFVHSDPVIPHITHQEQLLAIFSDTVCDEMQWNSSQATFPVFSQLIALEAYTYHVLLGLAVSAGGLTESLVRDSLNGLLQYVRSPEGRVSTERNRFCATMVKIFQDHQSVSRVTIPLIKMIDRLLSSGTLDDVMNSPISSFSSDVADLVKKELAGCGDPAKILDGAALLCDLLQSSKEGNCRSRCLGHLLILLCHRYPRVRMEVASKLFTAFVTYEDVIPPEFEDEVISLLSETDWGKPSVPALRSIRNRLCQLLNIPEPKLVTKG